MWLSVGDSHKTVWHDCLIHTSEIIPTVTLKCQIFHSGHKLRGKHVTDNLPCITCHTKCHRVGKCQITVTNRSHHEISKQNDTSYEQTQSRQHSVSGGTEGQTSKKLTIIVPFGIRNNYSWHTLKARRITCADTDFTRVDVSVQGMLSNTVMSDIAQWCGVNQTHWGHTDIMWQHRTVSTSDILHQSGHKTLVRTLTWLLLDSTTYIEYDITIFAKCLTICLGRNMNIFKK